VENSRKHGLPPPRGLPLVFTLPLPRRLADRPQPPKHHPPHLRCSSTHLPPL